MLADFADALYRAGNLDAALVAVDEAIAVARRRTDRIAELHATLLRGLVLAAAGDAKNDREVDELILRAEELLNVSGAAFFEPQLVQLRSCLERRK
jgi:adenylate cyclase